MSTYAPQSPLEAAILESGHFELAVDAKGQHVVVVGQSRLSKVVLSQSLPSIESLLSVTSASGAQAFDAKPGDPFTLNPVDADSHTVSGTPEEFLVIGLRPLKADRRPARIAIQSDIVRLYVMPWWMPARTIGFGSDKHFLISSNRAVLGDWEPALHGRSGVIVGFKERWIGPLERSGLTTSTLVIRSDVPVPWMDGTKLMNAVPTKAAVYSFEEPKDAVPKADRTRKNRARERMAKYARGRLSGPTGEEGDLDDDFLDDPGATDYQIDELDDEISDAPPKKSNETWIATVPLVIVEGNVLEPATVPDDIDIALIPDGSWERDASDPTGFDLDT